MCFGIKEKQWIWGFDTWLSSWNWPHTLSRCTLWCPYREILHACCYVARCLVTKQPAAVLPFDFSSAQNVKKHFHGKNQWLTVHCKWWILSLTCFDYSVDLAYLQLTANGFVWVQAHRSKIMSLTKWFAIVHFGFVCPGLQPCRHVSCHHLSGGSGGVPCYLFNLWDVNAFNLQTLQCFAAQLVMVVRCFIAATLLNKKRVKRTTLKIAKASGAELERACHGDSHRQRGKMTRCCIKLLHTWDTKTVSLLVPVALVRLRGSCCCRAAPQTRGRCRACLRFELPRVWNSNAQISEWYFSGWIQVDSLILSF